MKLFKTALAALAAIAMISASSCKSNSSDATAVEADKYISLSVDSLMSAPQTYLGDTIIVDGSCSHLCKHGGTKAFLVSADGETLLRCEATSSMGGAFSPDCIGKTLSIKGVVCENRITENDIKEMEEQHAKTEGKADHACATDAKAQGQDSISEFDARMADYRARINERLEKEGKDYLSFYYLESISYDVAE